VVQGVVISRVGSVSFSSTDRCGLITRVVTIVTDLSFYGDRAVADSPRDNVVCLLSTTGRSGSLIATVAHRQYTVIAHGSGDFPLLHKDIES